jgi:hypothetical protein
MRRLWERTAGLILLTATSMQISPVEVWDLLALLGLPPQWDVSAFLRFFAQAALQRGAGVNPGLEQAGGEQNPQHSAREVAHCL